MIHDRLLIGRGLLWPMDVGSPLWVIQNLGAEDELASQALDTLMDQWNQAHIFTRRLFIFPPSLMLDAPDLIPAPPRWATQHLLPWSDRLDGVLAEEPRDTLLGFWALPLTEGFDTVCDASVRADDPSYSDSVETSAAFGDSVPAFHGSVAANVSA